MSDLSARLDLPLIKPSQAQKHVTHNEALQVLDGLVQAAVEETGALSPPFEPPTGTLYALGAAPTGDWADQGGMLAYRVAEGWIFMDPQEGWRAWDKAEGQFKVYSSGTWTALTANFDNLDGIGVGTTSDAVNKLAVASDASLFTHDGNGHQMKLNKADAANTASLLFQSSWVGHAEMGLAGDTSFSIKVSDDGVSWYDAFQADAATGEVQIGLPVRGEAVQQDPGDTTAGRLLVTGAAATVLQGGLESRMTVGGTDTAIELTSGAGFSSVPVGYQIRFRAAAVNAGPVTINLDSNGATPCVTITGQALPEGYIRTDVDTDASFDGTNWVVDRQIERGSNANGTYIRFADGTQTCQVNGFSLPYNVTSSCRADWTFPAEFSDQPVTTGVIQDLTTAGNVTPNMNEILGLNRQNNGSNKINARMVARRVLGGANFAIGDSVTADLFACGSWY